jgi:ComF family protein
MSTKRKFLKKIKKLRDFLLDLIFPKVCLFCFKEGSYLHSKCLEKIPLNESFVCPACGKISLYGKTCNSCQRKTSLTGLIYATSYKNEIISEAIKLFKYQYVKDLGKKLAKLLIKKINDSHFLTNNFSQPIDSFLVIPIPLYRKKFLERGFNQSEILAKEIANEFGLTLKSDLLIKIKNTPSQTDLNEKERLSNVKDAFEVKDKKVVKGKIIFLIDDVTTTGATLNEAAKVLKKSGAKEVWGLTVAKG